MAVEFTDSDVNLTLVRLVFQTSSITYVGNVRGVTMCSSDVYLQHIYAYGKCFAVCCIFTYLHVGLAHAGVRF